MAERGKVVITSAGPYIVSGGIALGVQSMQPRDGGDSWEWVEEQTIEAGEKYALCRCGASSTKPFCDGTHTTADWNPTETAARTPFAEAATTSDGPTMTLLDNESLCAFARFCDNHGGIWNLIAQTGDDAVRAIVTHEATHCPSGRLVVVDKRDDIAIEDAYEPSIVLAQDPAKDCSGPLWLRGDIPIESQDGTPYEVRNRVTLCRCGASANKPFCDGTHVDVAFKDGLLRL